MHSLVDGNWMTSCIARQDAFDSYRITLQLREARLATRTEVYFADLDCQESLATLQYEGSYGLIVTRTDFLYAIDFRYERQALHALVGDRQQSLEEVALAVPLVNANLVSVKRGQSLTFGIDLAADNDRPLEVRAASPQQTFLSQTPD